ncbi:retrovirus-related pol polyprotein from transposon TNT 1-94, partial [Tanacetum coccineum]
MAGLLFRMFRVDRIEVRGTMHGVQVQLVIGELRTELEMQIQVKQDRLSATTATENGVALDKEQLLFIASGQDNVVDEDMDEQPVQDLTLNVDNVFQADDCDAFDSNVDEAPTTQTMFMENLSFADPVYDEADLGMTTLVLSWVMEIMIGDSVISRVYYVEGLGHNLFFVRQFYDSDLEVAFRKHSCYVRDTDGVELIKVPRTPPQNDVVERQNRTLVEAARTMLIFSKALMFLWAEAVA